ncbi:MAG: aldo/keto reductase [Spirochaetes bacterium]|nr:aldo/keto reductase [Spirochaetota bacterium]
MKFRQLGKSELAVSEIGLGTWQAGGIGWTLAGTKQILSVIEYSIQQEINFIDTAPIYGFGQSEILLGEIIPQYRKNLVIATKCGLVWDENKKVTHNLKTDSILKECEASLKRLKTDYIDLYYIHWPSPNDSLRESFKALNKLAESKVIKGIGVSNFDLGLLKKANEFTDYLWAIQPFYNMFARGIENQIVPFCKQNQISVIPYSPLCQGLLTGKIGQDFLLQKKDARNSNVNFTDRDRFERNLERVSRLKEIADKRSVDLVQLVIAWTLGQPSIDSIIAGTLSQDHIQVNLGALDLDINKEELEVIDNIINDSELKTLISFAH